MCKPCKCSTVSINHTSSKTCDLSQLTEVVFVMGALATHIAFSVQNDSKILIGVLPDKTLHYSLTESTVMLGFAYTDI